MDKVKDDPKAKNADRVSYDQYLQSDPVQLEKTEKEGSLYSDSKAIRIMMNKLKNAYPE